MFCSTVIIVATSTVNVKLYHTSVRLNWKQQQNNEKMREKKSLWYRRGQKQREMPYHFQNDHAQMLLHSALPSFYIISLFVYIYSYELCHTHCKYNMELFREIADIFYGLRIGQWSFWKKYHIFSFQFDHFYFIHRRIKSFIFSHLKT